VSKLPNSNLNHIPVALLPQMIS